MWIGILKWILKFVLERLGENLDAESQKQIDEYNRRKTELEKNERQKLQEIENLEESIEDLTAEKNRLDDETEILKAEIAGMDEKIERINNEKENKLSDLRRLDDDDVLHSEL